MFPQRAEIPCSWSYFLTSTCSRLLSVILEFPLSLRQGFTLLALKIATFPSCKSIFLLVFISCILESPIWCRGNNMVSKFPLLWGLPALDMFPGIHRRAQLCWLCLSSQDSEFFCYFQVVSQLCSHQFEYYPGLPTCQTFPLAFSP